MKKSSAWRYQSNYYKLKNLNYKTAVDDVIHVLFYCPLCDVLSNEPLSEAKTINTDLTYLVLEKNISFLLTDENTVKQKQMIC